MQKILRLRDVLAATGLKRSTLYSEIAAGRFARPAPLTEKCVGWFDSDVESWQQERRAARDGEPAKRRGRAA